MQDFQTFFPDFGVPVLVMHNRNLRRERPISYLKEKANSNLENVVTSVRFDLSSQRTE